MKFGTFFGDDETLGPIDVRIKCLKQVPLWILSCGIPCVFLLLVVGHGC